MNNISLLVVPFGQISLSDDGRWLNFDDFLEIDNPVGWITYGGSLFLLDQIEPVREVILAVIVAQDGES